MDGHPTGKLKQSSNIHRESANQKISFILQSKYINSPNSLINSAQFSQNENTRITSAYRRSNTSATSAQKSSKTVKDPSRIHNLKGMVKNTDIQIKHRKSENFRKIKRRADKSGHSKSGSKSNYVLGGSTVFSLKGQPQFCSSKAAKFVYRPTEEESFTTKTAGVGGTEGMYKLSGNLVQKIPTTKDVHASKIAKAFINKNKKILKNAINNGEYLNQPHQRRLSNIAKPNKSKKKYKNHKSSYSVSKDKILKTYKESTITSHSNYTSEPVKGHKRSSSDSQKLYDINNWKRNLNPPLEQAKCSTNENTSRFRKKSKKSHSKERSKHNKSTNHEKSLEKASMQIDRYYNPKNKIDSTDQVLVTPRSFHAAGQHSNSSKIKMNLKDTQELFHTNANKIGADSLNSNSKYSSFGGSRTIEKKRRKLKKTSSYKKRNGKPHSSKKSDKERSSSNKYNEHFIIKNYRSVNMTNNPAKIANIQDIENKKRYQYHKRIRSDTGNTIVTPLEHLYERNSAIVGKDGYPSFHKAKTDLHTPIVPNEEQRYSVLDNKMPINLINNTNTIQINKYDFAPSFVQHKNATLDSNSQYRKFKTNINPSKSSKACRSKISSSEKHRVCSKKSGGGTSYSQTPSKSHTRKASNSNSIKNDPHPYNYSSQKPESVKIMRDREINELEEDHEAPENGVFEYYFGSDPKLPEIQSKIIVKKNLQLQGDKSISISKETEENIRQSEARPLTITPDNISNNFIFSKPSSSLNNPKSEMSGEVCVKGKSKENETKPTTKIVQIDCHSLDPLDTTKSKDGLVAEIK